MIHSPPLHTTIWCVTNHRLVLLFGEINTLTIYFVFLEKKNLSFTHSNTTVARQWWHVFNLSTLEAVAGGSLRVQGQPGLQSGCQDSQNCYTEKPCLEKPYTKQNKQQQKQKIFGTYLVLNIRKPKNKPHQAPSVQNSHREIGND